MHTYEHVAEILHKPAFCSIPQTQCYYVSSLEHVLASRMFFSGASAQLICFKNNFGIPKRLLRLKEKRNKDEE